MAVDGCDGLKGWLEGPVNWVSGNGVNGAALVLAAWAVGSVFDFGGSVG